MLGKAIAPLICLFPAYAHPSLTQSIYLASGLHDVSSRR